jgi:hypothetical protein
MENWKDIKGYEGHYQVSDLGRVRSLKLNIQKILSNRKAGRYHKITLCKNGLTKDKYIHILVAETFLNYKGGDRSIVVDHINNDRYDNTLKNLQVITQRENISKNCNGSSKFYGVRKGYKNKWYSQIRVGNKSTHLGSFDTEERASIAYNFALTQLDKLKEYNLTR